MIERGLYIFFDHWSSLKEILLFVFLPMIEIDQRAGTKSVRNFC